MLFFSLRMFKKLLVRSPTACAVATKLGASVDMRNVILVPFLAGQMHYRGKGKTLNHVIRNT